MPRHTESLSFSEPETLIGKSLGSVSPTDPEAQGSPKAHGEMGIFTRG